MLTMNARNSFIATASGVMLTLTAIVAEGAAVDPLKIALAARQESTQVSPIQPLSPAGAGAKPANVVAPNATIVETSLPLQARVIDCTGMVRWRAGATIAWKDASDAKVNDLLSAGAEIRTGLRSRITLKFDNATVLVDGNSNFSMPTVELVKGNDGDVYRTIAQMKSGRADFQVDKVGAKNDFKVVTPSSTLAVRGTGFSVMTGAMTGTEVVGARTNAIAAIQLKYAASTQAVQLSGGGGEAKSTSATPEPATGALLSSVGQTPMAGTSTSAAERESSAHMGTSQTPAQTQVTSTIGAVATVAAEIATAESGDGEGGNGVGAVVADLLAVDGFVTDSGEAAIGADDAMHAAIFALQHAQESLTSAQGFVQNFRAAESDAQIAATAVAELLVEVNGALVDAGESRSDALENARGALALFAVGSQPNEGGGGQSIIQGPQGGSGGSEAEIRALTQAAITDAASARGFANEALYGSGIADEFAAIALERLNMAIVARSGAIDAASQAVPFGENATAAASTARGFLLLVDAARDEIASIYARRPLPAIAQSLELALDHLESASLAVLAAESARDESIATVMAAQAQAQSLVLNAVQAASLAAAEDALAALNAASAADVAAIDAQTGMAKLDLAIEAMLEAQDATSVAESERAAVLAFREIAQSQSQLAQAQVTIHEGAASLADGAQLDAAQALFEALGHLDDAIENSGFTTEAMQACLAALNQEVPDYSAAELAAIESRQFADATGVNAGDARDSADLAADHAGSANDQVQDSTDAQEEYASRLAQIQGAISEAITRADAAGVAATNSGIAAGVAQDQGTLFAEQFSETEAAAAALLAVQRAMNLAIDATGYANEANAARDDAVAALAEVTSPDGSPLPFGATSASAQLAADQADLADDAAIQAAGLAAIADAEAATAEAAVDTLGEFVEAQLARTVTLDALESAQSNNAGADGKLDQLSDRVFDVATAAASAQDAASAGAEAEADLNGIIELLEDGLSSILTALNAEDLVGAEAIQLALNDGDLKMQAETAVASAFGAQQDAGIAASSAEINVQAAEFLLGEATDISALVVVSAQNAVSAALSSATHAGNASAFAGYSQAFANVAIAGGSTAQVDLLALANAAGSIAGATQSVAASADGSASTASSISTDLLARIDSFDIGSTIALGQSAQSSAAQATASLQATQAIFALGHAEADTASSAVNTLRYKIDASMAATLVEGTRVQIDGLATDIDGAIQIHEEALANATGAVSLATSARDSAQSERDEAQLQQVNAVASLSDVISAMSSSDATLALSYSQITIAHAVSAENAATASRAAGTEGFQQDTYAAGLAETSLAQSGIAQSSLESGLQMDSGMSNHVGIAQQRALDASLSATASSEFALTADTALAQALADRALALSIAALERAEDAVAARDTANARLAAASTAIEQAGFGETSFLAGQVHTIALEANDLAWAATLLAQSATLHGSLADSAARAGMAGSDASAFGLDGEIALANTNFAHDIAVSAIDAHDQALGNVTLLFASAGDSLTATQTHRDSAVAFSDEAHGFFVLASDGFDVANNASFADGSAVQSEYASIAADGSAIQTRGYADQALIEAATSTQASGDFATALAAADGFVLAAGSAHTGATSAAGQAETFAAAAQNFALAIGSTLAMSASDFAIAARDQAIAQRNGASSSRLAALAAANAARTMGERVVFTRTAEIAGQTVVRADQARILAQQAIDAAALARIDANAALALVPPPSN